MQVVGVVRSVRPGENELDLGDGTGIVCTDVALIGVGIVDDGDIIAHFQNTVRLGNETERGVVACAGLGTRNTRGGGNALLPDFYRGCRDIRGIRDRLAVIAAAPQHCCKQ